MKKVIVIVGPTASGKTYQSVLLAEKINAEIINGDSVQIYKELNIGSAKIKDDEKRGIKHHLFDVRNVLEEYSAFNFQKDVRKLITEIDIPIIVGGTGFYIKSALYNYEFHKEENYNYNDYDDISTNELYNKLKKLDPNTKVDKHNRKRVVRAYYLALKGNKRSSKNKKDEPLYDILTFYLDIDRTTLKEILIKRLDIMLKEGFIEEVEMLKNKNIRLNIIGYRELYDYLLGEISLNEAKKRIIQSSMRLAKKQKTWFKNQMETIMLNALDKETEKIIYKKTKEFLNE